ncbi:MAG: hypothetical protein M1839_006961 [Geoglossum umbratile]|nr:MAG: hypothetical protein M1839_006961 [Geoglossum umbratile]
MDPLSAVGFAASILTFIDFSWNLLQGTYEVYNSASGTTAENAYVSTVLEDLQEIAEGLHSDLKTDSKYAKQLSRLAKNCLGLSRELTKILEKLRVKERNSKWQAVKATWASMRKEKAVASITKRLREYRAEIILCLNLMLFSQQSSVKAQLDKIHEECLHLSSQSASHMAKVHKDLAERIGQLRGTGNCSTGSEGNTSAEDNRILAEIRISLSELVIMANTISRENFFLGKLYFKSINQRENSVENPEGGSFEWMLERHAGEKEKLQNTKGLLWRERSFRSNTTRRSSDLIGTEDEGVPVMQDMGNDSAEVHIQDSIVATSPYGTSKFYLDAEEVERRRHTSESFISFLRNDHGVFFICGKAGSGKSTLLKFLAHHQRVREELESWAGQKKLVFIPAFFWSSGDKMQMSLEGFYRSILFKILKQCPDLLQDVFPDLWDRHCNSHAALSPLDQDTEFRIPQLRAAFQNLTRAECFSNYRFCFFVDGLDEYAGDSLDHIALAKNLKEMAESSDVKVVCSARPHTEFLDTFNRHGGTIFLHDLTRNDIRRYAKMMLMSIPNDSGVDDNREQYLQFADHIVDMADGVFLWARLVVRSLLSGITHSDSPRDLRERLENTPRDLNGLFRKMLDGIEDAVRMRSDKMLLVAIHNPFWEPLPALAYSWLSDLEDPKFPFSNPFEGYSDEDVTKRVQVVRHQVDALTRGLLEIRTRPSGGIHESSNVFPYFNYRVEFLHRSVRDYLREEWDRGEFRVRRSGIDQFETYCRLKLAEAKFARSFTYYDNTGFYGVLHPIYSSTFHWLQTNSYALPLNYFEEWGRVMESFRHLFSSHVKPDRLASCMKFWALHSTIRNDQMTSIINRTSKDTNYFHWVSAFRLANTAELFKQQADLRSSDTDELNILLTASLNDPDLVEFLLSSGFSPNEHVKVEKETNFDLVPVWMVFLRIMAVDYLDPELWADPETRSKILHGHALVFEQYLKFGADRDIYFLSYLETPELRDSREPRSTSLTDYVPSDEELFYVELYQLLELFQPKNFNSLQKLLVGSVSHQVWNKTTSLLAGLAPWIPSSPSLRTKYRPAKPDQLRQAELRVHGVVSKTCQLIGAFRYRVY